MWCAAERCCGRQERTYQRWCALLALLRVLARHTVCVPLMRLDGIQAAADCSCGASCVMRQHLQARPPTMAIPYCEQHTLPSALASLDLTLTDSTTSARRLSKRPPLSLPSTAPLHRSHGDAALVAAERRQPRSREALAQGHNILCMCALLVTKSLVGAAQRASNQ